MLYRTSLNAPIFGLRREIDRLFEDTFSGNGSQPGWSPSANIRESKDSLSFEFELPGLKPDQVEVTCDNGVLTVRGERREERKEGEEGRYHLVERTYGSFSRSFQLPQNVDEDQIDASFEDGLLTVRVPKAALPQPRRIDIQGGRQGKQPAQAQIGGSGRQSGAGEGKRANGSSESRQRENASGSESRQRETAGSGSR
jgi:HSP20 family protein